VYTPVVAMTQTTDNPQVQAHGEIKAGAEFDASAHAYQLARREHWDRCAALLARSRGMSGAYHKRLAQIYRFLVPKGSRVLEVGCAAGDLLAATAPSYGVGVDLSPAMIELATTRHPHLHFVVGDVHELEPTETFDVVILSDLVNDLWDVQCALTRVRRYCHPGTRVIMNTYSRVWQLPLGAARRMGFAMPLLPQNWLTVPDVTNLLKLAGFETIRSWPEVLFPLSIPLVGGLSNRIAVKLRPFRFFALANMIVARPEPAPVSLPDAAAPSVSVIVPARNEAGHIEQIIQRIPQMGPRTEVIFVEGNSTDDTLAVIEKAIAGRPGFSLYKQPGKGKGDAVRVGFDKATGDILMILDADLTVPPESLPLFYEALRSGKGEFINGVRLVYPMEDRAMRFLNLIANKFFSLAFSWLLGQSIKDTLCGTKVLRKSDYQRIADNRAYFGDFDPFGDFDLIFGAAKLNLAIVDLPIRYRERVYGETNIQRWRHGLLLLRMTMFAARRLKFV
jgi:SAM-dependent methyltransferase